MSLPRTWSFYVKPCRPEWGRTPELGQRRGSTPLGWGVAEPFLHVLPCHIWSFYVKGCRHKQRELQKVGSTEAHPFGMTAWLTPGNAPIPTRVSMPSLFFLGQIVPAFYGDSPEKNGSLRSALQGHSRALESTRIDPLPVTYSNHGPISCRFREKRRFQSKIVHFLHSSCF